MKNIALLSLLLSILLINSCSEDIEEDIYDINEGQLNWKKYAVDKIDRDDIFVKSLGINDISFVSDKIGYIIGYYQFNESYARVYKTVDGGLNWTKYHAWGGGATTFGTYIHFFNESNGYMLGEAMGPTVYKVENNEINYLIIDSLSNDYPYHSPMFFVDSDNGMIKNTKTTDGGNTWHTIFNPISFNISDYCFLNNNIGVCCSRNGSILRTTDFGESWDTLYNNNDNKFNCIYMIDSQTIIVGGNKIIKSNDGGMNWSDTYNEGPILDIKFIDNKIGFAASSKGEILKTYDGGETWEENYSSEFMKFRSLEVIDNQTIIAAGYQDYKNEEINNAYILKTTTQGE